MSFIKKIVMWIFIYLLISFVLLIIFAAIPNTASRLSEISNFADKSEWLQYLGSMVTTAVTVVGAFYVMRMQIKAMEKEKRQENRQQQDALQKIIMLLLKKEIDYNLELFNTKYLTYIDKEHINGFTLTQKFKTGEWQKLKYTMLEKLDSSESARFIKSLVILYYDLEKINTEAEADSDSSIIFDDHESMMKYLKDVQVSFDIVLMWFVEMEFNGIT